jgi:hypothetical protein
MYGGAGLRRALAFSKFILYLLLKEHEGVTP